MSDLWCLIIVCGGHQSPVRKSTCLRSILRTPMSASRRVFCFIRCYHIAYRFSSRVTYLFSVSNFHFAILPTIFCLFLTQLSVIWAWHWCLPDGDWTTEQTTVAQTNSDRHCIHNSHSFEWLLTIFIHILLFYSNFFFAIFLIYCCFFLTLHR